MKTRSTRGTRAFIAAAALGSMMAGGMATSASADSYTEENSAPEVSIAVADASVTPAFESTGGTLVVTSTVADANSLNDLASVTLCLWKTTAGDSNCADVNLDPMDTVKMTWTLAAGFVDTGLASFWVNDTSTSTPNGANTSTDLAFKVKPSEAAIKGEWNAKVIADDGQAAAVTGDADTFAVNYFGAVDATGAREGVSFGTMTSTPGLAENKTDGVIQANDASTIKMQIADFLGADTTTTVPNATGTASAAIAAKTFSFDCSPTATYDDTQDVRILVDPTVFDAAAISAAQPEAGFTTGKNSCELTSGGQIKSQLYTAAVTVTVAD